ncbi:30S ribosomal protein S10 alpha, chloroplastic-like [Chenopodium quinoa]|uniref:Small ribosomal subunit protein uS10c n=1 Tax=Chenopodium quinoa TaxID=63459 RepID=A0A803MWI1_CHEQI|nr:30S ribosomal protein S10 alpha, chloroplastic-like [Chenopodium quinoa]XP_021771357.1 30S ribosomal protein S10 alpha, chloroplastic-like [Chenopodium quinoa]XP_021771361.1 30S ribosomal protein S10 alpha, chloroplastic-like [Chenopodium quinoa]
MATSSISAALFSPLTIRNTSSSSTKLDFTSPSLLNLRRTLTLTQQSSTFSNSSNFTTFAAPETLEAVETSPDSFQDGSETSTLSIGTDSDQMAPKQKIRIKLRSYWVPLIEDSCKQIMDAARTTNAKTMGPVPLPTKKRIYCVLKSPHVHKDARFHFEIRTHQRLIDILYPTAQTIDSLMQLDLPAGVDVEVKL